MGDGTSFDASADGSSAGNAAAVLVKAFKTRNASTGERSRPPSGGMIPRNMFKYGSHKVLKKRSQFHGRITSISLYTIAYLKYLNN